MPPKESKHRAMFMAVSDGEYLPLGEIDDIELTSEGMETCPAFGDDTFSCTLAIDSNNNRRRKKKPMRRGNVNRFWKRFMGRGR